MGAHLIDEHTEHFEGNSSITPIFMLGALIPSRNLPFELIIGFVGKDKKKKESIQ
jgi:hypothetical protein